MKKELIEIRYDGQLPDNCIIIRKKGYWKLINVSVFLNGITEVNNKVGNEKLERIDAINNLEQEIFELKQKVNYLLGEEIEGEQENEEE